MSTAPGRATSGRFITLEGIDGAGKSTQADRLALRLAREGGELLRTREPGGTELAETLRSLFLARPMDALTEALLVFAARRDHLRRCIEPALARGATVLCDRFTDATFAYQGGGRGFDPGVLAQLESIVQQGLQPGLTLWFDLPTELAAERRTRARAPDRLEAEAPGFFERVREAYRRRAEASAGRIQRIDAQGTPDEVWARVEAVLEVRGW